jgi:hypothetical protein
MSYGPLDRGFILRFLNSGTKTRVVGFKNTLKSNKGRYADTVTRIHAGDKSRTGNRGSIAARNWFRGASHAALEKVSSQLQELIDKIIANEFV